MGEKKNGKIKTKNHN